MGSLKVVKREPVFDHTFGLKAILQFMQVDCLLFEGAPQPFDEDFDVSFGQSGDPGRPRKVRSLARVQAHVPPFASRLGARSDRC